MIKVVMLRDKVGTQDGFHLEDFKMGESYEMRDSAAALFISSGYAISAACFENDCKVCDDKQKSRKISPTKGVQNA